MDLHPVPYEEEEIRTRRCTGGPREDRGRRQPSTSQAE